VCLALFQKKQTASLPSWAPALESSRGPTLLHRPQLLSLSYKAWRAQDKKKEAQWKE